MSAYETVFKVQCKTARIAQELTGEYADVVRVDMSLPPNFAPPFCLRLRPEYRDQRCREFRSAVAREAWRTRH